MPVDKRGILIDMQLFTSMDPGSARLSGSRGVRMVGAVLLLALTAGCASKAPPAAPNPTVRPVAAVQRVAVVGSGESRLAVVEHRSEPGRTFEEVVKWTPHQWLRPLGGLVHAGINWLRDFGRAPVIPPDLTGLVPRVVVTDGVALRLRLSGSFQEVRTLDARALAAEEAERAGGGSPVDAQLRVSVPTWGLVRVRQGQPDLHSAFADVYAQLVIPGTGTVLWESSEDVTHPDRLPLDSFASDPLLMRRQLAEVLDRAGQQLAAALLYERGGAR